MIYNIQIGRQGEMLAASILEGYGVYTTHVDLPEDDLWVKTPHDKFFKVQVKSSSRPILHSSHHTLPKYSFALHSMKGYTGIVMYVALDLKLALAVLGTTIKSSTLKMKPSEFSKQAQDQSVRKVFKL